MEQTTNGLHSMELVLVLLLHNLIDSDAIDNLKLRLSYGQTGNEPGSSYISLQRFGPAGNFYYNGAYTSSYGPTSNANPDLAWEIATHMNVGVDFAVLNSKLFGSVEYFTRETKDQLLSVNVPVPPNLVGQTLLNIGTTKILVLKLMLISMQLITVI